MLSREIAMFEWASLRNETKLHQSLRYRNLVEVETEFWKQIPPLAIEIKAKPRNKTRCTSVAEYALKNQRPAANTTQSKALNRQSADCTATELRGNHYHKESIGPTAYPPNAEQSGAGSSGE